MEASRVNVRDVGEIERAVVASARKPNGGLVVTASSSALTHRDQIIALATRLRLAVGKGENSARRKPVAADRFAAAADEWLKRPGAQPAA